jgi:hypothetical protein
VISTFTYLRLIGFHCLSGTENTLTYLITRLLIGNASERSSCPCSLSDVRKDHSSRWRGGSYEWVRKSKRGFTGVDCARSRPSNATWCRFIDAVVTVVASDSRIADSTPAEAMGF